MSETNEVKNLWGDLDLSLKDNIRTPYVILKEQAALLGKLTNNLLIGHVIKNKLDKDFENTLRIKVPSLNSYTYSVLKVDYSIGTYPLTMQNFMGIEPKIETCENQEEFESCLEKILSSSEMKRIISSLISDIKADNNDQSV